MNRTRINLKEVKAMATRALKEAFPDVKFSVRMCRGRSNHIDVEWTDGPSAAQVDAVVAIYGGSYFDGMQDLRGARYFLLDGQAVTLDNDSVWTHRQNSDVALLRAIDRVFSKHAEALAGAGIERPSVEAYRRGALMCVALPRSLGDEFIDLQGLIRRTLTRHTDRARVKASPTRERIQLVGDDGNRAADDYPEGERPQARPALRRPVGQAAPVLAASATVYQFEAPEQLQ